MESFFDLLDQYVTFLSTEKGFSKNTIDAYKSDLIFFFKYLHILNYHDVFHLSMFDVVKYLLHMRGEHLSSSTIKRRFVSVKMFLKYLKKEGIISQNVLEDMQGPKVEQKIPDVLSEKEVAKLLNQPDTRTLIGSRDRAILEVLYACGLRVSELCNLEYNCIQNNFIKVKGKGGKERLVPIHKMAQITINNYLEKIKQFLKKAQGYIFVTLRGKKIDRVTVWKMVKKYIKMAGIKKNVSPHTFRHTFATHLLDHGADIRVIQDMLGHESVLDTDRYTHISTAHLKKAFNKFHPRK